MVNGEQSFHRTAQHEDEDPLPDPEVAGEFYERYDPQEVLGRGISSIVRRCTEKLTGLEYAVKIIDISGETHENSSGDSGVGASEHQTSDAGNSSTGTPIESLSEAAMRETQMLRLVAGHEYIINLHDVFKTSHYIFLVFEL